ncbi:MAG: hypothetical protein GY940_34925, partial [bacterium]|nr:hypothetical protein [bacterium]
MELIDYQIRILGLNTRAGSISISLLKDIADMLLKSSDRVLRLCVEGQSTKSGKTPEWLKKSLDFTVTGMHTGSTVIQLEAPTLNETIPELFVQKKLWRDNDIKPGDSALSLLSRSVSDAAAENRESDYFDVGVLDALLSFKSITTNSAREIDIRSNAKAEDNFKISSR